MAKLKDVIDACIYYNRNVDEYKDMFTNEFAFWLFKQCIFELKTTPTKIKLITSANHVNQFLLVGKYLFGCNDDGKIFGIYDVSPLHRFVTTIYHAFDYDYDIVDEPFPMTYDSTNSVIKVKINAQDLDELRDNPTIRISGDLLMQIITDDDDNIKSTLYNLFRMYMQRLISLRFAQLGLITSEDYYVYYSKYFKPSIPDVKFNVLIDEFEKILNDLGFDTVEHVNITFDVRFKYHRFFFDFAGARWLAELTHDEIGEIISFKIIKIAEKKDVSNEKVIKEVLEFIGADPNIQQIVAHLGNHKIIVNGYHLPVITVGNKEVRLDGFVAKEIVCEHPEHLTVSLTFDDCYMVNFSLIQMPMKHQIARNMFTMEKLMNEAGEQS
jgi:hypothetical protein